MSIRADGTPATFDYRRFYLDVDAIRGQRHADWQEVWMQARTHFASPAELEASFKHTRWMRWNTTAGLAAWAGLDVNAYARARRKLGQEQQAGGAI